MMNELLAIIAIVVLCCLMFCAWLASMAGCPDRMVDLISGASPSQYSSYDSKELIASENDNERILIEHQSSVQLQLGGANRSKNSSSKKLSLVPEADEQSTVASVASTNRPSILRRPALITRKEDDEKVEADRQSTAVQELTQPQVIASRQALNNFDRNIVYLQEEDEL